MADEVYATYPGLRGKVVIVSGGADGIGASIVESFARQGSTVIFLDVATDMAKKLLERVQRSDPNAKVRFHRCDVSDLTDLQQITNSTLQDYPKIDVLSKNAARDTRMATSDVTPEFWDGQVAVNLRHQFFMIQYVMSSMKKAGAGSIVNLGSINWAVLSRPDID